MGDNAFDFERLQLPFFEQTFCEVDPLINKLTLLARDAQHQYVFRGYNKQDQLYPGIIRGDTSFSDVEDELLEEFEKFGSHYFHARTPIDFISYGQHYGLPTRLLDFTYNPFIALSFALFSKKSSGRYNDPADRHYYYIRFCDLHDNIHLRSLPIVSGLQFGHIETDSIATRSIGALKTFAQHMSLQSEDSWMQLFLQGLYESGYHDGMSREAYISSTRQKIETRKLCFVEPNQSNQRVIMQQGLFMLPYTLIPSDHNDIIRKNTETIRIHKDLRTELLSYLDTLGYNTFRLMPDLSSVCTTVTQKVKDGRLARSELFRGKGEVHK